MDIDLDRMSSKGDLSSIQNAGNKELLLKVAVCAVVAIGLIFAEMQYALISSAIPALTGLITPIVALAAVATIAAMVLMHMSKQKEVQKESREESQKFPQKTSYSQRSSTTYDLSDVEPSSKDALEEVLFEMEFYFPSVNFKGTANSAKEANQIVRKKLEELISIERKVQSDYESYVNIYGIENAKKSQQAVQAGDAQENINRLFRYRSEAVRYLMKESALK